MFLNIVDIQYQQRFAIYYDPEPKCLPRAPAEVRD